MTEETIKVVNLFTRAKVTATVDVESGIPVVTVIDGESLKLAEHVIGMIRNGDLIGLAIVGVNPKSDVPVLAATDSLPRLYQETLRLFALDLVKEGMTDLIHDRIDWKDAPLSPEPAPNEETKTPDEPVTE